MHISAHQTGNVGKEAGNEHNVVQMLVYHFLGHKLWFQFPVLLPETFNHPLMSEIFKIVLNLRFEAFRKPRVSKDTGNIRNIPPCFLISGYESLFRRTTRRSYEAKTGNVLLSQVKTLLVLLTLFKRWFINWIRVWQDLWRLIFSLSIKYKKRPNVIFLPWGLN